MDDKNHSNEEIVEFWSKCIVDAYKSGASDIHFEQSASAATSPDESNVSIRFRIDGTLADSVKELPLGFYGSAAAYLKDIAGLRSGDHKKPSYAIVSAKKFSLLSVRLGCCFIPNMNNGLDLVIRLFTNPGPLPLDRLGLRPFELQTLRGVSYGIVLFSGSTGSGKHTLLSSVLHDMKGKKAKVWALKEEISISLFSHVNELNVAPGSGNSYEDWMNMLINCMDPDAIYIGSLKGPEKFPLAVDVALGGVAVLADIHANSACDAITRYMHFGQKVYSRLLVDALAMVVCQRLQRRLCPHCKTPVRLEQEEIKRILHTYHNYPESTENKPDASLEKSTYGRWLKEYGDEGGALFQHQAKGCNECNGSGYKGRVAVVEVVVVSPEIRALLLSQSSEEAILKMAMQENTSTMRQDAIEKALGGVIGFDQIDGVSLHG